MSDDHSELEAKLTAMFEADHWTIEQGELAEAENGSAEKTAEIKNGSAEKTAVREVHMNVTPSCFCGNRPSVT